MPEPGGGVIEARGLGFKFSDGAWAFRGVDFELRAGRITLLAGRNGAGKTMLAKNLSGLLRADEGRVSIEGRELASIAGSPARHVGYVFQDARLQVVGETAFDDALFGPTCLGLPPEEARERARVALERCGLSEKAEHFVHELSGGELRRLAIAGAVALEPKALILDEPFANLDPEGVGNILELIRDLAASGLAVLVISHEIEKILGLASAFYVMDAGRIALAGDPEEVLRRGIEVYGLRDPFRPRVRLEDLTWL